MVEYKLAQGTEFEEPHPASDFIMPSYPGMGEIESGIWEEFLGQSDLEFLSMYHNVHLGPGGRVEEWASEEVRRMWKAKTRLRVDAIGEAPTQFWIFEVKPRFGRSAEGQLTSYSYYFVREKNPRKPAQKACVCNRVDPNMRAIAKTRNVQIFQV